MLLYRAVFAEGCATAAFVFFLTSVSEMRLPLQVMLWLILGDLGPLSWCALTGMDESTGWGAH